MVSESYGILWVFRNCECDESLKKCSLYVLYIQDLCIFKKLEQGADLSRSQLGHDCFSRRKFFFFPEIFYFF